MHCHICDAELSEKEIIWNEELNGYEPCSVCLEIIFDAAFSDGFHRDSSDIIVASIEDTDPLVADGTVVSYADMFKTGSYEVE
jgi:hypothetical protein